MIAKFLSIIAKIILARSISTYAMSIYSLAAPTMILLINLVQLGIPTTISKLIAKNKFTTFKIMQVAIIIMVIINLIIGTLYIVLVPTIANSLLKSKEVLPTLYGLILLLPLVSATSLIKGYFIGINEINKANSSQISEEISRILFIIIFSSFITNKSDSFLSFFAMFSAIVGEMFSLIHLFILLNVKRKKISKRIYANNENNRLICKTIFSFSLPTISSRLLGSLTYFIEPIIYTALMLKQNVSNEELTLAYGIFNSYVTPLLLLPGFLSSMLSLYLLPKLSKEIELKCFNHAKSNFLKITFLSLIIGIVYIVVLNINPSFISKVIYGKEIGIDMIKKYSILIIPYYIQAPLHICVISFNKEKHLLYESILINVLKIGLFYILIPIYLIDGLIISTIISLYCSIIYEIILISILFIRKNKA